MIVGIQFVECFQGLYFVWIHPCHIVPTMDKLRNACLYLKMTLIVCNVCNLIDYAFHKIYCLIACILKLYLFLKYYSNAYFAFKPPKNTSVRHYLLFVVEFNHFKWWGAIYWIHVISCDSYNFFFFFNFRFFFIPLRTVVLSMYYKI